MWLGAALSDKVACQRHIARLLCYLIQTHQRQLNFRVARIAVQLIFAVAESVVDMIGRATNDAQQPTLTGGLKEGDACFNQMPGAIKLVALRRGCSSVLAGLLP